jgi:glycine betaine catabolism B
MINIIDNFLNRITMYRLVLYYLIVILVAAVVLSFFHVLPYDPLAIIFSSLFLVFFCGYVNDFFASVFEAPTNMESVYITALILALIITPVKSLNDFIFLGWAAGLAMASKYILAINKKHLFNPVAIAVALTAFGISHSASWWVGNLYLMPLVVLGGLLITRKIRREDLVISFFLTVMVIVTGLSLLKGGNLPITLNQIFFHSSLFFLGFVMLTEPLTTPPTKNLQLIYGVLVGLLFIPQIHVGGIYSTPELALLVGNIFAYLVSPKEKFILKVKEKIRLGPDMIDFIFPVSKKLSFLPGQYMEWTLAHKNPDSRGSRRYFTLASSPTEDNLRIGVKFYQSGSSYKKSLLELNDQTPIVAGQRAGDFTLPKKKNERLAFMAGGIGVTPFRSMIKYLLDKDEARDIVLFYSNRKIEEIVYRDVFDQAATDLEIKVVYTLTDRESIPVGWTGKIGRINDQMIKEDLPDYQERLFYLSGPHAMVTGFEETLKKLGVKENKIIKDYFPGFV